MTNFTDVGDFHEKFGLYNTTHHPVRRQALNRELMDFRVKFMQEELDEFQEGLEEKDHAKMADALVDLVYVAMGTAHLNGYPWERLWAAVQEANMRKVKAKADGSDSKRGSAFDVVKPEGWTPPDIDRILFRHGWY